MKSMHLAILPLFYLMVTAPAHAEVLCADMGTTQKETLCMTGEVDKANKKLASYLQTAKSRLQKEGQNKINLESTQKAWEDYRSAHCGDVYTFWAGGSIRHRQMAQCQLDLTLSRTRDVWQAYLTFADSTPPLLPAP
ncbi:lysozyme inhibitor LprI family protein [Undibacterium sp. Di27W]|uniref:lysozyme inhibitor LprI family protein n=1 Tax=Undibacterium sp. Di27W TaxID=3413036 RepID=UPI003BEFC854